MLHFNKELFSVIFENEVRLMQINIDDPDVVDVYYTNSNNRYQIGIARLASKCKIYASANGYNILSDSTGAFVTKLPKRSVHDCDQAFYQVDEVSAVIQATGWVHTQLTVETINSARNNAGAYMQNGGRLISARGDEAYFDGKQFVIEFSQGGELTGETAIFNFNYLNTFSVK